MLSNPPETEPVGYLLKLTVIFYVWNVVSITDLCFTSQQEPMRREAAGQPSQSAQSDSKQVVMSMTMQDWKVRHCVLALISILLFGH